MSLITVIICLLIVFVLLWAINTYVPMAPQVQTLLHIGVVIVVVLWLVHVFGLADLRVPR